MTFVNFPCSTIELKALDHQNNYNAHFSKRRYYLTNNDKSSFHFSKPVVSSQVILREISIITQSCICFRKVLDHVLLSFVLVGGIAERCFVVSDRLHGYLSTRLHHLPILTKNMEGMLCCSFLYLYKKVRVKAVL